MASSSKQKTDEEIAKELAESRKVTLTSAGGLGSGKELIGTNGANSYGGIRVGDEYLVRKDGDREYIDIGGARAYWDPEKNTWKGTGYDSAGGNHRASHFNTVNVAAQPTAAPASSGGGKPPPKKDPGKVIYPPGQGPVLDTNPGGGGYANWQAPMFNYQPITHGQHLNPLVDPNQWVYTPDPQFGILNNPGIYSNNPQPMTGVLV